MRLRDCLTHPNFAASAMSMDNITLLSFACHAVSVHRQIQALVNDDVCDLCLGDLFDWKGHILSLMLLRDCLGREMVRRGMTPPAPPMLASNWESGGIYKCVVSSEISMPPWLVETGNMRLASAGLLG